MARSRSAMPDSSTSNEDVSELCMRAESHVSRLPSIDQICEKHPRTIHKRSRMTNNNNHHQLSSARDASSFRKHEEDQVTNGKIDVFDSFTTESTMNTYCTTKRMDEDEEIEQSLPSIVCFPSSYPTSSKSTKASERGKQNDSSHTH